MQRRVRRRVELAVDEEGILGIPVLPIALFLARRDAVAHNPLARLAVEDFVDALDLEDGAFGRWRRTCDDAVGLRLSLSASVLPCSAVVVVVAVTVAVIFLLPVVLLRILPLKVVFNDFARRRGRVTLHGAIRPSAAPSAPRTTMAARHCQRRTISLPSLSQGEDSSPGST